MRHLPKTTQYLTPIKFSHTSKNHSWWVYKCICGTEKIIHTGHVNCGNITSCGCIKTPKYHSDSYNIYQAFKDINKRCYDIRNKEYKNYGGRGISVCDEWKNNLTSFRKWAISHGYKHGLTIDRTNNNDGYSPENCRWVTQKEQMRNTRVNRLLTYNGETHCLAEWAEILNIPISRIHYRLKMGWTIHRTLSQI